MASLNPLKTLLIILTIITCNTYTLSHGSPLLLSHKTTYKLSTIAAEPTVLFPYSPLTSPSPALSPDITPLFPTPIGSNPPTESSLPFIPSSPSPPNPDSLSSPHPEFRIAPGVAVPESFALGLNLCFLLNSAMVVLFCIVLW